MARYRPVRPPMVNSHKSRACTTWGVRSTIEPLYSVAIQLSTLMAVGMAIRKRQAREDHVRKALTDRR